MSNKPDRIHAVGGASTTAKHQRAPCGRTGFAAYVDRVHRRYGAVVLLLATLFAGCAGDDGTTPEGVTVNAVEMKFTPKAIEVKPGHQVITVHNNGKLRHTFSINSLGSEVTVNPGETKELEIDVAAGTYRYVCRVLDHEGLGMRGALRVKE